MTAHAAELTEAHSQIFNTFRVHVNLLVILYTDFSFYECKLIFSSVFCCFISLILFLYDRKNLSHAADICLQFLFAIYKSRLHHGHQGLQVEHDREREREEKKEYHFLFETSLHNHRMAVRARSSVPKHQKICC